MEVKLTVSPIGDDTESRSHTYKKVAALYAHDGIEKLPGENRLVCAYCSVYVSLMKVAEHVDSPGHIAKVKHRGNGDDHTQQPGSDSVNTDDIKAKKMQQDRLRYHVMINGLPMTFDTNTIIPELLFGVGRCLFDDTLGLLLAPDACRCVHLIPGHQYTVIELITEPEMTFHSVQHRAPSDRYFYQGTMHRHPRSVSDLVGARNRKRQLETLENRMRQKSEHKKRQRE